MNAKQLGKRLLQIVIVALGITFLTFLITYLAPGDPVRTMFAATGVVPSEELVQETREEMGLNRPVLVQYFDWLTGCLRGDFGTSYSFHTASCPVQKPPLPVPLPDCPASFHRNAPGLLLR